MNDRIFIAINAQTNYTFNRHYYSLEEAKIPSLETVMSPQANYTDFVLTGVAIDELFSLFFLFFSLTTLITLRQFIF